MPAMGERAMPAMGERVMPAMGDWVMPAMGRRKNRTHGVLPQDRRCPWRAPTGIALTLQERAMPAMGRKRLKRS